MSGGSHVASRRPRTPRPRRPPRAAAAPHTFRGYLWVVVMAVDFFLLSNPLVFEPAYFDSLTRALLLTTAALVATFWWAPVPRPSLLVLGFLGWALLSASWSVGPSTTAVFWIQGAVVAAIAVAIASQVQPPVMQAGLVLGGVGVAAVSWYAHLEGMYQASFLTLDGVEGIAGVGTNRNILAYTLVISIGALVAHVPVTWLGRLAWTAAAGLLVFTLYSAASTTGYAAGLAALVVSVSVTCYLRYGGWLIRSRLRLWSSVLGLVTGLGAVVYTLARAGGEDILSISGRLPFWEAGWDVAQDQMVAGYGWGAVWAHPWVPAGPNPVADRVYAEAGVVLNHGHNSLIDVLVELGLVGVALIILIHAWILVRGSREVVRAAQQGRDGLYARLLLSTLAAITVTGVSEPMSVIPLGWWSLVLLLQLAPATDEAAREVPVETDAGEEAAVD